MLSDRQIRDLLGLALFALALFAGLSLLPPALVRALGGGAPQSGNLMGVAGAHLSDVAYVVLGAGAPLLPLFPLLAGVGLFGGRNGGGSCDWRPSSPGLLVLVADGLRRTRPGRAESPSGWGRRFSRWARRFARSGARRAAGPDARSGRWRDSHRLPGLRAPARDRGLEPGPGAGSGRGRGLGAVREAIGVGRHGPARRRCRAATSSIRTAVAERVAERLASRASAVSAGMPGWTRHRCRGRRRPVTLCPTGVGAAGSGSAGEVARRGAGKKTRRRRGECQDRRARPWARARGHRRPTSTDLPSLAPALRAAGAGRSR